MGNEYQNECKSVPWDLKSIRRWLQSNINWIPFNVREEEEDEEEEEEEQEEEDEKRITNNNNDKKKTKIEGEKREKRKEMPCWY